MSVDGWCRSCWRPGYRVRVDGTHAVKLHGRAWESDVEVVQADAHDPDAVAEADVDGVDVAYYLLHSIGTGSRLRRHRTADRPGLRRAAADAAVTRIVYLGGLDPEGEELSEHLASRAEVGRVLLDSGVPTVVLRAGVIIGSGSASFEMLRYLTERLPVMVTPRWVHSRIQPIAIRDVLRYLVGSRRPARGRQPGLRHRRARTC